ncbi:uncharacterized protein LOC119655100 isoform X3 [Hermetia illucens]|nr:uncharacterized protein LOC119655100 isoform X3 [Hermetia illucens]
MAFSSVAVILVLSVCLDRGMATCIIPPLSLQQLGATDPASSALPCPLLQAILKSISNTHANEPVHYVNATEGPNAIDTTESSLGPSQHLKNSPPIFVAIPNIPQVPPVPIHSYVTNHGSQSPVEIERNANGGLSIHVSTKIDFSGNMSLLQQPVPMLGPFVFNNNIQLQFVEPSQSKEEKKEKPCSNCEYPSYSDDEDYYIDDAGSGSHQPMATTTTESDASFTPTTVKA